MKKMNKVMNMKKMNIFEEIEKMRQEMDNMFRRQFQTYFKPGKLLATAKDEFAQPFTDVEENKNNVKVNIDLPGVNKKDIQITIKNNAVEIKAEKKHEVEIKNKGIFKQERSYSGYYRAIPLPTTVNSDQAQAKYKEGVLTITIPKKHIEKNKSKRLKIG